MAMVRLVLRDEYDVGLLVQLFQRRDAGLCSLLGHREEAAQNGGWAGQPGIDEDGEGGWEQGW